MQLWKDSCWPDNPIPAIPNIAAGGPVEVGVKFRSDFVGVITGVRFYKGQDNPGVTYTGSLWSASGTLLATGTFTTNPGPGWQELTFGAPVKIMPKTTYIASYHTDSATGMIALDEGYFNQNSEGVSGSLRALKNNAEDGPNGVYHYGGSGFPSTSNGQGHNYWVDVRFTPSRVTQENFLQGTDTWRIQPANAATNREIEGYASLTSVNRSDAATTNTINLFVSTNAPNFTYTIYRMGWYNGLGGRQMQPSANAIGVKQPDPPTNTADYAQLGLMECNWQPSVELTIPSDWPSGYYLAKLATDDGGGGSKQSYIIFVVRDDTGASDILVQSSVATWQAYNYWPGRLVGKSLYDWGSNPDVVGGRPALPDCAAGQDGPGCVPAWANGSTGDQRWGIAARKVSFNRPYSVPARPELIAGVGAGEFFGTFLFPGYYPTTVHSADGWEYNFVRWLEREGYDVSYCTDVDVADPSSNIILRSNHKAVLAAGHSEYWSMEQRQHVTDARDAGVNLGFFTGNTCVWQVRYEKSTVDGAPLRTLVGYKGHAVCGPAQSGDPSECPGNLWRQAPVQGLSREDPLADTNRATTLWTANPVNMPAATLVGVQAAGEGISQPLTNFNTAPVTGFSRAQT